MIQDILPARLDNAYRNAEPGENDRILIFDETGKVLVKVEDGKAGFADAPAGTEAVYLFSIDDVNYFLPSQDAKAEPGAGSEIVSGEAPGGFSFRTVRDLRRVCAGKELFAAFTAWHLWRWYRDSRHCGRCGSPLVHDLKERAMRCPECGNVIYPRINPAVIVGVIKGDSMLITRYRTGYGHNALVAGFTEIGETLEETVAREVMEETGVKVKNITYYKSQPWGIAQDILTGFFCEAEGDGAITMDPGELKYAEWVKREEIELQPDDISLTNEMMRIFRDGRLPHNFRLSTSGV